MTMRLLVDAAHPEETRVVVINGNRLEDFDYASSTKIQLRGNIYLAKVTRVEPSLQAAFVDYGETVTVSWPLAKFILTTIRYRLPTAKRC